MVSELFQVLSDKPKFTAGFTLVNDVCTEAAPIIKYFKGKRWDWIKSYCRGRGFQLEQIDV